MKEHCGVEPPVSQVIQCCMKTGLKLAAQENLQPVSSLPSKGSDRLLLEIDGTMVPCILAQAPQGDRRKGKTLGYKEMRLAAARDLTKIDPVFAAGFYDVEQAGAAWSRCALAAGWSIETLTPWRRFEQLKQMDNGRTSGPIKRPHEPHHFKTHPM